MILSLLSVLLLLHSGDNAELLKQLQDRDPVVRLRAAKLLGASGEKGQEALPALSKASVDDADEDVRYIAKQATKKIEQVLLNKKHVSTVGPLENSIRTGNATSEAVALEKVAKLGIDAEGATEAVISALTDRSRMVRDRAINALEQINPLIYEPVVTILVDRNFQKRNLSVSKIGNLGPKGKAAAPLLIQILYSDDQHAVEFSGINKITTMESMEKMSPDNVTYFNALFHLIQPKFDNYGRPLYLNNEAVVRAKAIELISNKTKEKQISSKRTISAFVDAFWDSRNLILLVEACGKFGAEAKESLPALRKLRFHTNQEVREAVTTAMDSIEVSIREKSP